MVITMGRAGVTPSRIVTSLRNDGVSSTLQDIYNIRAADRRTLLAGRTPLVALLDNLAATPEYYTKHDEHKLTHLMIISPTAKEICQKFSAGRVWLIDATYKTNKFNLPLLHIVGITATNTTYTFAYCFIRSERAEDYMWAMSHLRDVFQNYGIGNNCTFVTDRELALMNALDVIFPNANCLLCRWHINKNILTQQKRAIATQEAVENFSKQWNSLVAKDKVADYETQLASMRLEFSNRPNLMRYVEDIWLIWKDRFVTAFLRNKCHYGHCTTSRVESAHAALKKWISVSTGDLLTVDTAIKLACDGQLAAIVQENARQRTITTLHYGVMFSEVMGKISKPGLKLAHQAYGKRFSDGEDNHVTCRGLLTSTMGHPCQHAMRRRQEPLTINDFDQHWWLIQPPRTIAAPNLPRFDEALAGITHQYAIANNHRKRVLLDHVLQVPDGTMHDPVMIQTRGRPTGSTRRDPSQFERVGSPLEAPLRRRCRNCNREGHNARTCIEGRAPPAPPAPPRNIHPAPPPHDM